jgi:hypothetical protein
MASGINSMTSVLVIVDSDFRVSDNIPSNFWYCFREDLRESSLRLHLQNALQPTRPV